MRNAWTYNPPNWSPAISQRRFGPPSAAFRTTGPHAGVSLSTLGPVQGRPPGRRLRGGSLDRSPPRRSTWPPNGKTSTFPDGHPRRASPWRCQRSFLREPSTRYTINRPDDRARPGSLRRRLALPGSDGWRCSAPYVRVTQVVDSPGPERCLRCGREIETYVGVLPVKELQVGTSS